MMHNWIKPLLIALIMVTHMPLPSWSDQPEEAGPSIPKNRLQPSLMFSNADIKNLLKVMQARDIYQGMDVSQFDVNEMGDNEIFREIQRRALKEREERRAETTLPDLYISSIIYRSDTDWKIWLRKHLFQPLQTAANTDISATGAQATAQDLDALVNQASSAVSSASELIILSSDQPKADFDRMEVVAITPSQVTLLYRPDAGVAALNRFRNKETPTPRIKQFNNRIVQNTILYDEESNEFTVKLEPNQTFSLNMMRIVEGKTVKKTRNVANASNSSTNTSSNDPLSASAPSDEDLLFITNDSPEAAAANKLIQDLQQVQQFIPVDIVK